MKKILKFLSNSIKTIIAYIVLLIIISLLCFLFGCKTKTLYVPVESIKTEYKDRLQRDSIYLYDSVFVEKWKVNDTVFYTKEKYKYLYRDKLVRDSIYITDSIQVPYPVTEYIEVYKLKSWQHFLIWCGVILILIIISFLGIRYLKKLF